jgi:hypothetical protein
MDSSLIDLILRLSYLHVISYGLVAMILCVAIADAYVLRHLRKILGREAGQLKEHLANRPELNAMVHPIASGFVKARGLRTSFTQAALRRQIELAEAALFVPLRSRIVLTRDLSTLMGLIATLLALVAAAIEFAKDGKPELLIGSVGTGCMATCVAAIGCAIALWNLSRLTRIRLQVDCDTEAVLDALESEPEAFEGEVPIRCLN